MKEVPIIKHLVARRCWRPLAQAVTLLRRPLLRGYDWLFGKKKLEQACFWLLAPLSYLHLWLCRKASQARGPQLFRHSSFAYDFAAVCAALLGPFAKWHAAALKRMKDQTDPRLRDDGTPVNRNGAHKHVNHEQH